MNTILELVNEFEGGKLLGNDRLKQKWEAGFKYFLFGKGSNWEGYDVAREKLDAFEENRRNKNYKDDFKKLGIVGGKHGFDYDYLSRSKVVPLRAMFLFTSEDVVLENYIKHNYNALNSISGDFCDIYLNTNQLFRKENAYDFLSEIELISKVKNFNINHLPGVIFWNSRGDSVYVSLEYESTEFEVKRKLRNIFEIIRNSPNIDIIEKIDRSFNYHKTAAVSKVLFASANPKNTSSLRLNEEVREIENALKSSMSGANFEFRQTHATRVSDFRKSILEFKPHIVHFSGHGDKAGILLEDELGGYKVVSSSALEKFFSLFKGQVECVILNACYSREQAYSIVNNIPYVIGMNDAIPDNAAIKFATAFYEALSAGKDIEFAFKFGVANIELEGVGGSDIPELLKGS